MGKSFAQIESSLPHSKKLRQLNHKEKWAYLCAHVSPLGGYIGIFRYPLAVWADDADVTRDEIEAVIKRLEEVGLITFDPDTSCVRIHSWFLKKNAPENASRMTSMASDFADLDAPLEMAVASIAEFAVGSVKRAQKWKPESTEWAKLRSVFKPFLATMLQNFEDDLHEALKEQLEHQNKAVRAELGSLLPALDFYLQTPCPHPADTVAPHETRRDDTKTTRKEDEDLDGDAPQAFSANAPSGQVTPIAEVLRKSAKPFPSTINSPIAQAAREAKL